MSWKPKFYIIYPDKLIDEITWPEGWRVQCIADLCPMLREVLNTAAIGSEIKLIWNEQHRHNVVKENDVTYKDLEDYLRADCSMLSFKSQGTMNRAAKALKKMGSENFICVSSYRDVIMQQAHHKRSGAFSPSLQQEQQNSK